MQLKLGSSISLTPSKNMKNRAEILGKLDSNIDYDIENLTVKSNSFTGKNIKRFKITKIPSSHIEQEFLTDPNEILMKRNKIDEAINTPKSAKVHTNQN